MSFNNQGYGVGGGYGNQGYGNQGWGQQPDFNQGNNQGFNQGFNQGNFGDATTNTFQGMYAGQSPFQQPRYDTAAIWSAGARMGWDNQPGFGNIQQFQQQQFGGGYGFQYDSGGYQVPQAPQAPQDQTNFGYGQQMAPTPTYNTIGKSDAWGVAKGGHKECKEQDETLYVNLLKEFEESDYFNNRYKYQYMDGYDQGQKDKTEDFFNQNNQNTAYNSNYFHAGSNSILPTPPAGGTGINTSVFGFFQPMPPPPMREEQNIIIDSGVQPTINNSCINTFKNDYDKSQIDDLQELLQQSTTIQKARAQAGSGKFTDLEFPPDVKSIIGFGEGRMSQAEYSKYPWLRPEQYFQGTPYSVYNRINSEDIEQGGLGDCYFLASISALAEHPQRCERLFLTKKVDPQSIYALALCHDGIWSEVLMDDQIPCQQVSKTPLFNRSTTKELWVILLEKAWAKINGGFQNIAAGLCREALRSLTGASCKTFFTQQNREEIWKAIYVGEQMDFIMTAASDDLANGSDAYQDKVGICGSHAYSLLGAYELVNEGGRWRRLRFKETSNGQVERLVKLRNPWGSSEWKGNWSDTDPKWNDQLRRDLGITTNPNDGIFCMPYGDFCKFFSDLQICYYHDKFKYSAVKLTSKKNGKVYLIFDVHVEGVYYLSVNQKMKRAFPKSQRYNYSSLTMTVTSIGKGQSHRQVASQAKDDFENWVECMLKPGTYAVEITTNWTSFVNEFSFSIYGPEKIPIGITDAKELPKNMSEHAVNAAGEADRDVPSLNFASQNHPDISYKINDNGNGAGYVYFCNKSAKTTLIATADLTQSRNIALKAPRTGLLPMLTVDPGQSESLAFFAFNFPYSFQMKLAASFDDVENRNKLIAQTRQSMKIQPRKNEQGQEVQIWSQYYRYDSGIGFLYVNQDPELTLNEKVTLTLNNCQVVGATSNVLDVQVPPNSEKFLHVQQTNKGQPFDVQLVNLSTFVARAV